MYAKIKLYFHRIVYTLLIGSLIYLLFSTNTLYFKYENMSVTLGITRTISDDIATINEMMRNNNEALQDTDAIIEDAKRRGIFD